MPKNAPLLGRSACGERHYFFFHKLFIWFIFYIFTIFFLFLIGNPKIATLILALLGVWRSFSYSDTLR
jgi:hypothetical protein